MPYNPDAHSSINYTKPVERNVTYRCKVCKVEVMSKTDFHAILGQEHKKSCPRHRLDR